MITNVLPSKSILQACRCNKIFVLTFVLLFKLFHMSLIILSGSEMPRGMKRLLDASSPTPKTIVPPKVFANDAYVSHMLFGNPPCALLTSILTVSRSSEYGFQIHHEQSLLCTCVEAFLVAGSF